MQDLITVINYDFISQDCPNVAGSDYCDFPDICQASFMPNTTQYYICQLYFQGVWYPVNQLNPPHANLHDWYYLSSKLAQFFKTYNDAFLNCPLTIDDVPIDSCFFFVPNTPIAINPGAQQDNWEVMKMMSMSQYAPLSPPTSCNCTNITGLWATGQGYCLLKCDPPPFPYWVGFNYASDYCNTTFAACNVGPVYYFRSLDAVFQFLTFEGAGKKFMGTEQENLFLASIGGVNQSFARAIVDPEPPDPKVFDGRWLMAELLVSKLNVYYQTRHNNTVFAFVNWNKGACLPISSLQDMFGGNYVPDLVTIIERSFLPQVYGAFESDLTNTRYSQKTEYQAYKVSAMLMDFSAIGTSGQYIVYDKWMTYGPMIYEMLRQINADNAAGLNSSSCLDFKPYVYDTGIPSNPYDLGFYPFPPKGADLTFPSIDGLKSDCVDLSDCTTTVLASAFDGVNIILNIIVQILTPVHNFVAGAGAQSVNFGTSLVTLIQFVLSNLVQWGGTVILSAANWADCLLCAISGNKGGVMCDRILFSSLDQIIAPAAIIADAFINFVVTLLLGVVTFLTDLFSGKFGDAITTLWNTIVNLFTDLLPKLLVLIIKEMLSAICLCGVINTLSGSNFCDCTCGCNIGKKRSLIPGSYGNADLAPQVYDIFAPYWYIYSDYYQWAENDPCNTSMPIYRGQYFTLVNDTWPNNDIPQEITYCLARFIWKTNTTTPGRLTLHDMDKCNILMQDIYLSNPPPKWSSFDILTKATILECIQQRAIIVTAKGGDTNGTLDWLPDNIISAGGLPSVVTAFVVATQAAPIFMQRAADLNYPQSVVAGDSARAASIIEVGGANFGTGEQRAAAFANGVPSVEAYVDATPGIGPSQRNPVISMIKMLEAQFGQEAQTSLGTITYKAIDTSMAHLPSPPNSSNVVQSVASFTEDLVNASAHPSGKGMKQKIYLHIGQAASLLWKGVKAYGAPTSSSSSSTSSRKRVLVQEKNLTFILGTFAKGVYYSGVAFKELFSGQAYKNVSTMVASDAGNPSPYPTVIPWVANPHYRPLSETKFSSISAIFPERLKIKFGERIGALSGLFRERPSSPQTKRVYRILGSIKSAYVNGSMAQKYHYQMPHNLRVADTVNGVTCLVSDELCEQCMVLDQLIGDVIDGFAHLVDYFSCIGASHEACFSTSYSKFLEMNEYLASTNDTVWVGDSPYNPIRFPNNDVEWYRYAGDTTPNKLRFHDVEDLWNQTYSTVVSLLGSNGIFAGTTEGSFTIASCSRKGTCSKHPNAIARPTYYRGEMDVLGSLAGELLQKTLSNSEAIATASAEANMTISEEGVFSELGELFLPWLSWLYENGYSCEWTIELDDSGKRFSIAESGWLFVPALAGLALVIGIIVPSSFTSFFAAAAAVLLLSFLTLTYSWSYSCFWAMPLTLADDIMYALVYNIFTKCPLIFNGMINEVSFNNNTCSSCAAYQNRTFTLPNCYKDLGFTSFLDNVIFLIYGYSPSFIKSLQTPSNWIEPFQTLLRQPWIQERLSKWNDFDPSNEISFSQHYQCAIFVTFVSNAIIFALVLLIFGLSVPSVAKALMLVCTMIWIGFWFLVSTVAVIVCLGDMPMMEESVVKNLSPKMPELPEASEKKKRKKSHRHN